MRRPPTHTVLLASMFTFGTMGSALAAPSWSEPAIQKWHDKQGWQVGANFIPSTAINQLEMWQADTFDPKTIDKELAHAKTLGMNTMRVFLHDLVWRDDPEGFKQRIDTFLGIAAKHGIRPMMVLFDSVWNPDPKSGPQPAPRPGVHNSGWVQSPGRVALQDSAEWPRLEAYVKGVVGAFGKDRRIHSWDVWNEPDNTNGSSYGSLEPANKEELVAKLLPKVFEWARAVKPKQPLTSGLWRGDWSSHATLTDLQRIQLDESDFVTFHNYDDAKGFIDRLSQINRLSNRPKALTEYMARPRGSTFEAIMPISKSAKVGVFNWGFFDGKSGTKYSWDSWDTHGPYAGDAPVWFHEIYRTNGRPYKTSEVKVIRQLTGADTRNTKRQARTTQAPRLRTR